MMITAAPTVNDECLTVRGRAVLTHVPGNIVVSPVGTESAFLGATSSISSSRHVFVLGILQWVYDIILLSLCFAFSRWSESFQIHVKRFWRRCQCLVTLLSVDKYCNFIVINSDRLWLHFLYFALSSSVCTSNIKHLHQLFTETYFGNQKCRGYKLLSLFRVKIWWMIPRIGRSASDVPMETQLLLLKKEKSLRLRMSFLLTLKSQLQRTLATFSFCLFWMDSFAQLCRELNQMSSSSALKVVS